jgi:hypothetical protein
MPAYTASVAAGTAVVGYNILNNERWNRSPVHRILSACGLAGSAAILDTQGDLYIDEVRVSSFFNTALGAPQVNRDMQPLASLLVPAGAELQFIVTDAPATSPINITLSLQDIRAR